MSSTRPSKKGGSHLGGKFSLCSRGCGLKSGAISESADMSVKETDWVDELPVGFALVCSPVVLFLISFVLGSLEGEHTRSEGLVITVRI